MKLDFSDQLERLLLNQQAFDKANQAFTAAQQIRDEEMTNIAEVMWSYTGERATSFVYGGFTFRLRGKNYMTHNNKEIVITPLFDNEQDND